MSKKTSIINGSSLVCGIVGAVFSFVCRTLTGSPLDMIHKLNGLNVLPPVWIFNLLSVIWYFLIGAAAGLVTKDVADGRPCGRNEIGAYRGIAFFLVAFFMGLLWYPAFFAAEAVFIALIVCLVAATCAILCAYNWFGAGQNIAAVIMAAYSIWSIYVFIINFSILFGI